ncbi:MAG: hypothetical protein VX278_22885 [Myxococcota bacterium]|nr:hypothetical protein [Myxococcota bacterium]
MLFKNDDRIRFLLPQLAETIQEMEHERVNSGIETTPDETSNVIEAFFNYVGRLWIAELMFLTERASDETFKGQESIFRFLYDYLALVQRDKNPTIGLFVRLSREIQNFFVGADLTPHLSGLRDIRISRGPTDPSDRLLRFRNNFAHGSFSSLIEDINTHYFLLEELMMRVPGLWQQPLMTYLDGGWYWWDGGWSALSSNIGAEPTEGSIYIPSVAVAEQIRQGQTDTPEMQNPHSYMPIFPLYGVQNREIVCSTLKSISLEELYYSQLISAWRERYSAEKSGKVDRNPLFAGPAKHPFDRSILSTLQAYLRSPDDNLYLIEYYAGGEANSLLNEREALSEGFDASFVWNIESLDLTQSGQTFAKKLILETEKLLGSVEFERSHSLMNRVKICTERLRAAGKRILILVSDLHLGLSEYRGEADTVVSIVNQLIETPFVVISTIHKGFLRKGIFYDKSFSYPQNLVYPNELKNAVELYADTELKKRILRQLSVDDSLHLFTICTQLEKSGDVVFEPKVEYALWALSPLLNRERRDIEVDGVTEKQARHWRLFHSKILEYV